MPSAQRVGTRQDEDVQRLNQARDTTAAVLQDELIQAADRERQLQMQMDKMKDDVIQLQMWLERRSELRKDFDNFRREREMKQRDSRFTQFQ